LYTDDTPVQSNELYGGLLLSRKAHARILNVDSSEALAMDGVHSFYCYSDIEPERNVMGPIVQDEYCFAPNVVTCVGQIIGILIADTQVTCNNSK